MSSTEKQSFKPNILYTHCPEPAESLNHDIKNTYLFLFSTDNVTVVLKDNNKSTKCYGEVHINKNGKDYAVCGSTWSKKEAEVVCKELGCGRVSFQYQLSVAVKINCLMQACLTFTEQLPPWPPVMIKE